MNERDGNVCLLPGVSYPEAACIVPSTTDKSATLDLDWVLQSFWGVDKALAWSDLFQNPATTQSIANYLSLGHHLSFKHNMAMFALKPVARTPTTITLQFHWLRRTNLRPWMLINASPGTVLDWAGLRDAEWGSDLAHRPSGAPINTGQTFVVRAEREKCLPNFELLELRWNMLRVAAICGAGEDGDE